MLATFQHIIKNILLDYSKIKFNDICIHASWFLRVYIFHIVLQRETESRTHRK